MASKFIGALAGAAAIVLSGFMGMAPTQAAAPHVGCHGSGCKGKDPQLMGCAPGAFTGARKVTPDGRLLELRYSAACGAAWGRVGKARAGDYVAVYSGTGKEGYGTYVDGSHTWTKMVQDGGSNMAYATYGSSCCDSVTASY